MHYVQNKYLKVGLDETSGYGISKIINPTYPKINMINAYDKGRLIQNSIYGDPDGSIWNTHPWMENWIQSGDWKGKSPQIEEAAFWADGCRVITKGIHWATGETGPVTFMQEIQLTGPIIMVKYTTWYEGTKTSLPRHQESPAMFINPKYYRLLRYQNNVLVENHPSFPNEYYTTEKGFITYLNNTNYGIGVVADTNNLTAYRYLPVGGEKSWCSYVAPIRTFGLTPGLVDVYTVKMTVGTLKQIQNRLKVYT